MWKKKNKRWKAKKEKRKNDFFASMNWKNNEKLFFLKNFTVFNALPNKTTTVAPKRKMASRARRQKATAGHGRHAACCCLRQEKCCYLLYISLYISLSHNENENERKAAVAENRLSRLKTRDWTELENTTSGKKKNVDKNKNKKATYVTQLKNGKNKIIIMAWRAWKSLSISLSLSKIKRKQ